MQLHMNIENDCIWYCKCEPNKWRVIRLYYILHNKYIVFWFHFLTRTSDDAYHVILTSLWSIEIFIISSIVWKMDRYANFVWYLNENHIITATSYFFWWHYTHISSLTYIFISYSTFIEFQKNMTHFIIPLNISAWNEIFHLATTKKNIFSFDRIRNRVKLLRS